MFTVLKWANLWKIQWISALGSFNNHFKLTTDVHPYNTTKTKKLAICFSKNTFKLRCENDMIKYSAAEIWSKIHLEIKDKPGLTLF